MTAIYEKLSEPDGLAVCDYCRYAGGRPTDIYVTRLNVPAPHRGNGVGGRLLSQLCEKADREGRAIFLMPIPYDAALGEEDESYDRLVKFYKRHGFKPIFQGFMRRAPR